MAAFFARSDSLKRFLAPDFRLAARAWREKLGLLPLKGGAALRGVDTSIAAAGAAASEKLLACDLRDVPVDSAHDLPRCGI